MAPTSRPISHDVSMLWQKPAVRPGLQLNVWRVNVLLVEDDEGDTELILRALRQHPDVEKIAARASPSEALRDLQVGLLRPTIILLDVHLPKLDGFQFIEKLRCIEDMRNVPVVLLTTSRSARDVEKAGKSSACAYLVKPDQFDEFQACIHAVIKKVVANRRR